MGTGKTNPHIDRPTEEQLRTLVQTKSQLVSDLYIAAHQLVLECLPGAQYAVDCKDAAIGYGARQYGYDGWGVAALSPHTNWVTLAFLRGALLDDPAGLLEGASRLVRHVKLRSLEQFAEQREALRALILAAARVNEAGPHRTGSSGQS